MTVAPTTTAPFGSVTVPVTSAELVFCAVSSIGANNAAPRAKASIGIAVRIPCMGSLRVIQVKDGSR
jgi:hypothetical protein